MEQIKQYKPVKNLLSKGSTTSKKKLKTRLKLLYFI